MSEAVLIERHGRVAVVTLNLPGKRNALDATLVATLADSLTRLQDDATLRALVLTGGQHFCSGGDLTSLDHSPLLLRQFMQLGQRIVRALSGGPLPVVAAVEGGAYGAGFSLAMACDLVVADGSATFCAAFGRVGLMPDLGLLWTLSQRVGAARAREIVMLCDPIAAPKAYAIGLIDRFSEDGGVQQDALALAQRLAQASPATMAATKAALALQPLSLNAMLAWEADTQALLVRSDDFAEGVSAFKGKRLPDFKGT